MSLEKKIFSSVSWLAIFRTIIQIFSWAVTLVLARILLPEDYGLMSLATIIVGYAEIFSQIGLGPAIIQANKITKNELNSVFWFSLFLSVFVASLCIPLSFLTANMMHEPRVIPLTQVVGVVFVLTALQTVPFSLLNRDLNFKLIGQVEMISTLASLVGMLVIAKAGGGAWALLAGRIIRSFLIMLILFIKVPYRPNFHFAMKEVLPLLKFSILFSVSMSLFYVWEKSDRFIAGKYWAVELVGLYSYALQLVKIPSEKIISLINQVSFPAFASIKEDPDKFNKIYLNFNKVTALISLPLFTGGYIIGGDLICLILPQKWWGMINVFRFLCISECILSLNALNNFVHNSKGKPYYSLFFNIICAIAMPISMLIFIPKGFNYIVVPWLTTYAAICLFWIFVTTRTLKIPIFKYFANLSSAAFATMVMAIVLHLNQILIYRYLPQEFYTYKLFILMPVSIIVYSVTIFLIDKKFVLSLYNVYKNKNEAKEPGN